MTREEAIKVLEEMSLWKYCEPESEAAKFVISVLREQDDRKVNKPLTMDELHKFIGRCVWWNGETCFCENGYLIADDGTFSFDWVLSHGDVYCRNPESKDSGRCNFCKDQWISVDDALPEPLVNVLAWDKTWGEVMYAYVTRHNEWVGVILNHEITHWMPLPEPPEVEV